MAQREHFGSRLGFVLAAAGSAVGLGNIWKFPYMTGQNGGGIFLIIYLALAFSVGLSVMLAEFAIGRAAERNPVGAFAKLRGGAWPVVGALGVVAGFIILSFYGVVAGWTLAYVVKIASGLLVDDDPQRLAAAFETFVGSPIQPIVYQIVFMTLTIVVVIGGVAHGIERSCKVLMPGLFLLLLVLVVRALTLPGALAGIEYYLKPDFSNLSGGTINAALSQAFFSLSLGMGAMLTYGSYLSKQSNLPGSTLWVTSIDASVALLAGLLIMPAVFAFGFDPSAGPGLTFITLPAVFAHMPLGAVFAVFFFVLLVIAALTSAVSLLEVVVAYFVDEWGFSRTTATIVFGAAITLLGIPASLSFGIWGEVSLFGKGIFDLLDYLTTNLLLPVGGICISLFAGWVVYPRLFAEATNQGGVRFALAPLWSVMCKFIAPLAIGWILLSGL